MVVGVRVVRGSQAVKRIIGVVDGDIQRAVPARQGHLLLRAARQSAAVPAPRPEGHAVVVGAEAVACGRVKVTCPWASVVPLKPV